jgi:hypothetical protein
MIARFQHMYVKRMRSVGSGRTQSVAHAVAMSSAVPILLEAAGRARPCLVDGWQINAAVTTDSSKDVVQGSCRSVLYGG